MKVSPAFALVVVVASLLLSMSLRAEDIRDGILVHLSAGESEPQRVLMALKMAQVMAEGGKAVLVYCDIDAVKLLVAGAPDVTRDGFVSSNSQIAKLLGMGVAIRACPSCLAAAGKTGSDLIDGVKLADSGEFFSFANGRILTIDY